MKKFTQTFVDEVSKSFEKIASQPMTPALYEDMMWNTAEKMAREKLIRDARESAKGNIIPFPSAFVAE